MTTRSDLHTRLTEAREVYKSADIWNRFLGGVPVYGQFLQRDAAVS